MIPDDQIEEVRARADIVDIVGEFVQLKRSGREWKANCPFHDERTPSFYVVPDKGFYKCFGCQESGDVFTFVMKRMGLDFIEAVRWVAQRSGVALREVRGERPEDDPLRPLHEANAFAADWFARQLLDDEVGTTARSYLAGRGIGPETIERFGLGWAPDDRQALRSAAARHGIPDDILLATGLLSTSEKSPEPYDRFRGRIIFPIRVTGGKVVAFGGRLIGEGQPKYLNSPETVLYHKGQVLYGLDRSRHAIRREGSVLVVEGYMDLVSLAAAGFDHVVATLGTAMTPEHAQLLRRYTSRALLLFDSDAAGLRATFKAGDLLLANAIHPSVVTLPDGEDPDTLVRGEGPEALQRHLDHAVDLLDRKLQILEAADWFASIDRRRGAVDKLLPTLRATVDPALRDIYIDQVATRTGVRRETLEAELAQGPSAGAGTGPAFGGSASGSGGGFAGGAGGRDRRRDTRPDGAGWAVRPPATQGPGNLGPEARLLQVLARDRERRIERVEYALMRIGPEDFRNATDRAIFEAFMRDPELDRAPDDLTPQQGARLGKMLAEPGDVAEMDHGDQVFRDSVAQLAENRIYLEMERLQHQIEATDDDEEKTRLVREKQRLRAEAAALGVRWAAAARKFARGFNEPNRGS